MKNEGIKKIKKETCAEEILRISAAHLDDNVSETTVEKFEKLLADQGLDIPRWSLIAGLKGMDSIDFGRFIVGRRNHLSRFRWNESPAKAFEIVMNNEGESHQNGERNEDVGVAGQKADHLTHADFFVHKFLLRPDFEASVKLPLDFSQKEAARLAKFLETIPMNEN